MNTLTALLRKAAVRLILQQAYALVELARKLEVTLRISQRPLHPLAMGHHETVVEAWVDLHPNLSLEVLAQRLETRSSMAGFNEWFYAQGYTLQDDKDIYHRALSAWISCYTYHKHIAAATPSASATAATSPSDQVLSLIPPITEPFQPSPANADHCADKVCGITCTACSNANCNPVTL